MRRALFALTVAGLVAGTGTGRGDETREVGRAMYLRYCGACHGPEGRGDGVAGTFMRPKPADLTRIAERNGGKFPLRRVIAVIDGRETVRAHGDPAMPVWGEVLRAEPHAEMTQRAAVQGKLLLIAEYLRSIQQD